MKKKLLTSALFLFVLSVTACSPSGNGSHEVPPELDTKGFNDIKVDSEIHTEAQKEFLEYDDGPYAKMPKTLLPNGQNHLSDSLPVTLTWDYELPEGKEVARFSIIYGQDAQLADGYKVDGDGEETIQIHNVFLGTNYYRLLASYTDGETNESPIMTFNVDSCYPRNLTIEGMTN
ncbi:MAG: hypothetical protein K6G74_00595, partial [Bacilli bacterium]|nr:hypothetical protein [Bacilli bacterium]